MKLTDLISTAKAVNAEIKKFSASAPEFLYTSDKEKVKVSDLPDCFNISELKWSKELGAYLLTKENRAKAEADALRLNSYISEARKLLRSFPSNQFSTRNFKYAPSDPRRPEECCRLHVKPYTKTGKLPKYPMMLYIHASDKLFAEIYYGHGGEIGKVHMVSRNSRCYELDLATVGGELIINAIYEHNPVTFEKQKMYFIPPKKA